MIVKPYRIGLLLTCLFLTAGRASLQAETTAAPKIISVKKIWDHGGHNAFTDLIEFEGKLFCTFRESGGHVEGDGEIRVLSSPDGNEWRPVSVLTEKGVDLRDPKFSITPDHRLMLVFGGTIHRGTTVLQRQPRVAFSRDGSNWTPPQRVLATNDWLWRVTWHDRRAYGVVYTVPVRETITNGPVTCTTRFIESDDGIHYRTVATYAVPDYPNEATARFLVNGDCVVLLRRDAGDKSAWIGVSPPPYTQWTWNSAGIFVGGPDFIVLQNGPMIVAGRELGPTGAKTFVGRMDLESVTPEVILPSGGDCSYPGLVMRGGYLWVSYYSSHEGKASIYVAKLKL